MSNLVISSCRRALAAVAAAAFGMLAIGTPAHAQVLGDDTQWLEQDVYQGSFISELNDLTFSFQPEAGYGYRLRVHGNWFNPLQTGLVGYDVEGHKFDLNVKWLADKANETFTLTLQPDNVKQYSLTVYGASLGLVSNSVMALQVEEPPIAPIPEPATAAMTLAGLGVLGWVARRRRGD